MNEFSIFFARFYFCLSSRCTFTLSNLHSSDVERNWTSVFGDSPFSFHHYSLSLVHTNLADPGKLQLLCFRSPCLPFSILPFLYTVNLVQQVFLPNDLPLSQDLYPFFLLVCTLLVRKKDCVLRQSLHSTLFLFLQLKFVLNTFSIFLQNMNTRWDLQDLLHLL